MTRKLITKSGKVIRVKSENEISVIGREITRNVQKGIMIDGELSWIDDSRKEFQSFIRVETEDKVYEFKEDYILAVVYEEDGSI